jgi:5-formyltetrahydrofolate cyclo-ligase
MRAIRRANAGGDTAAAAISRVLFPQLVCAGAVAGYAATCDELSVWPLLGMLAAHGVAVGLPCVEAPAQPLSFRLWLGGQRLSIGAFGIEEPLPNAAPLFPRVMLMPLLAVDQAGHRLGYGGGFYDRTLALYRSRGPVLAIGIALSAQVVPAVPHESTDMALDAVATPMGFWRVGVDTAIK